MSPQRGAAEVVVVGAGRGLSSGEPNDGYVCEGSGSVMAAHGPRDLDLDGVGMEVSVGAIRVAAVDFGSPVPDRPGCRPGRPLHSGEHEAAVTAEVDPRRADVGFADSAGRVQSRQPRHEIGVACTAPCSNEPKARQHGKSASSHSALIRGRGDTSAWASAASLTRTVSTGQGDAVAGAALYIRYGCINCHGPNGLGGVPNPLSADGTIPVLSGQGFRTQFNTDAKIAAVIRSGSVIGKAPIVSMPHWGGIISNRQMAQLIAYLKTLK
jgi:mono/diheme cytochrome c family protein